MVTRPRSISLGAAGGLLLTGLTAVALATPAPAGAAARPGHDARQQPHPADTRAGRGADKSDRNGDRIADDLAARLATARPGQRIPVIVQGSSAARARTAAPSLRTGHRLAIIHGFSGTVTARQVRSLSRLPGVTRVELNGVAHMTDLSGNTDYGVTDARAATSVSDGSLDGSGVGICLIDTGIDPNHELLAGRVVGWKDWVNGRTTPYDDQGHGTHVAGIAAGKPTSAANAAYGGVAPGAVLIGAKVLDSTGNGADADVVSAIQWCAARPDVNVISMSLGSPTSDGSDAGSQAVDAAVAAGKVVVVAAGNNGDGPGTILSPGVATDAITVGAASDPSALAGSTDTDAGIYLAGFSSRGPTTNPAAPNKPDLVAPGISVVSAKAGTTSGYTTLSGTSMATPFVAGVVALGLEAAPSATPAQVKSALLGSADDAGTSGPDDDWGHGLVDARAFIAGLGAAAPGTAAWPAQQVVTGTVGAGATVDYPFDVTASGQTLGITLRTTNGQSTCTLPFGSSCLAYAWSPDLDAFLVDPSGTVVANSKCMASASNGNCGAVGRSETIGIASAAAGTWRLRVQSYSGSGSFSAVVFGAVGPAAPPPPPPTAPTGLSASALSTTSVALSWTLTSTTETGVELQRCQGTDCTAYGAVASLPAGTASYTDTGLATGTSYTYRVRAVNGGGASDWSLPATTSTPSPPPVPSAPSGLTVKVVSYQRVDVAWTDTSDNEDGFRVVRCTGKYSCGGATVVATLPAGSTSWSDLTVAPSTAYGYRVEAFNAGGSATTATVKVTTPGIPAPPQPTGLTATAQGETVVGLTWVDGSTLETGFELQRCAGAGCTSFATIVTVAADTTSYTDTGVVGGTSYTYRIRAKNGSGTSAWSATATASTPVSATVPPAPGNLTVKAVSATRVDLAWSDASTLETGFRVYRCTGKYACSLALVVTLPADTTSWSDTTVVANTTYGYEVEAFNASGARATAVVKVTTPRK